MDKDWREDYLICEHVKRDSIGNRHSGFRVCCENCYERGFLAISPHKLLITQKDNLEIAKIIGIYSGDPIKEKEEYLEFQKSRNKKEK